MHTPWVFDEKCAGVFDDRHIMVIDLDPCFGILTDREIKKLGLWIAEHGPDIITGAIA